MSGQSGESVKTKLSDFFSETDLANIESAVADAELKTSGEIRVVIRTNYDKAFAGNLDGQAMHDFAEHGLANTQDKTGVLILIVLSEKEFKILADENIHNKMPGFYLNEMALTLSILFSMGKFADGVVGAVEDIGNKLAEYFPRKPDDKNELSDKPIIDGEEI